MNHIDEELKPVLSQQVMSDLVRWHALAASGATRVVDPAIAFARCVAALADVRLGALHLFETAITMQDAGDDDDLRNLLRVAADRYRDICPEWRPN